MVKTKNTNEGSYDENGESNEPHSFGLNITQKEWIENCERFFGMNK